MHLVCHLIMTRTNEDRKYQCWFMLLTETREQTAMKCPMVTGQKSRKAVIKAVVPSEMVAAVARVAAAVANASRRSSSSIESRQAAQRSYAQALLHSFPSCRTGKCERLGPTVAMTRARSFSD